MASLQTLDPTPGDTGNLRKVPVGLDKYPTVPTAAASNGVTVTHAGEGPIRVAHVVFDGAEVTITDEAGVVAYGGLQVLDFEAARVAFIGASMNATCTYSGGINADADGDFGVGTVTASNNASLATTEQNIIPTTAIAQAASSATTLVGGSLTMASLDGSASALDVFVNILIDDADQDGGGTATLNGDLFITYSILGPE